LLLYTTRGCFSNPTRDQGRVMGHATVRSTVKQLDKPVEFADRSFAIGCSLGIDVLAPFGTGVELIRYVSRLHSFPNPGAWSAYLRRTLVALDEHDYDLLVRPLLEIAVARPEAIADYSAHGSTRAPSRRAQDA
jgi:hypothetical protein